MYFKASLLLACVVENIWKQRVIIANIRTERDCYMFTTTYLQIKAKSRMRIVIMVIRIKVYNSNFVVVGQEVR